MNDRGTRLAIRRTGAFRVCAVLAVCGFASLGAIAASAMEPQRGGIRADAGAEVGLYCANIRDAAHEARVGWQAQSLLAIEARIEARMRELADLRADYEEWLARRQEFLRRAEDGVIDIYARMRPDAAAAQLASMDNETAGAVIARLNPRQSSAILNEMEPGRAAQLTKTVAGSALTPENAL